MKGRLHTLMAAIMCCVAVPVQALDLTLPANARETASRDSALDQVEVPVGPYAAGAMPIVVLEGPVTRRAYRIPSSGLTPLQILAPLRAQLESAGYQVLLDCNQDSCGGFDFRFAIDVLPAPNMYVNIRAYHFLSVQLPDEDAAVTLLASAAAGSGYLQVMQVSPTDAEVIAPVAGIETATAVNVDRVDAVADRLMTTGRIVLRDLDFGVGATALTRNDTPNLAAVAALLKARPALRIAVVGHTDSVGGLDANIGVSRSRAQSVRAALIDTYDAPASRIDAEGMGYLAPIASNLTEEGREANRRVEVIVVSEEE